MMLALFFMLGYSGLLYGQKTIGLTKIKSGYTEKGYILFAPLSSNNTYLINKCGKQINNWKSDYPAFSVHLLPDGGLLRTGITNDTFFMMSGKAGVIEKFDWDGDLVWSYKLSNDSITQHHDIYPLENGNILLVAWDGISSDKAESYGRLSGTLDGPKLWSEKILEIKPIGNDDIEIVWEWSLSDHLVQDEDIEKANFGNIAEHPELLNVNYSPTLISDWIHLNGIDYNKDLDQILVSSRNLNEIWIIDHSTTAEEAASHIGGKYGKGGDFLYRWGNAAAYNLGSKKDQKLFGQHNAHWIPKGYKDGGDIMIFNNGTGRDTFYSSVEIISPPVVSPGQYKFSKPYGPSKPKWVYRDSIPKRFYSPFLSGSQRLPNGNTLICNGQSGKIFEIDSRNKTLWEYINPVTPNNEILTDGNPPNGGPIFRSIYYSDTFSAFKGRTILEKAPVELKPYPYKCPLPSDLVSPKIVSLLPATKSSNISRQTNLEITFNEPVMKGTVGQIYIYENKNLVETIGINDSRVAIKNAHVTINPSIIFNAGAQIAIMWSMDCFNDSVGNTAAAMDSVNWKFSISKESGIDGISYTHKNKIFPNPAQKVLNILFSDEVPKIQIVNNLGHFETFGIRNQTSKVLTIDISSLSKGMYSLLINGQFSQTFIKL